MSCPTILGPARPPAMQPSRGSSVAGRSDGGSDLKERVQADDVHEASRPGWASSLRSPVTCPIPVLSDLGHRDQPRGQTGGDDTLERVLLSQGRWFDCTEGGLGRAHYSPWRFPPSAVSR